MIFFESHAGILQQNDDARIPNQNLTRQLYLDEVLEAFPDLRRARELQDKIAAAQVQETVHEDQRTGWMEALDWSEGKAKLVLGGGIVLLVAAVLFSIPVIQYGMQGGFSQEIYVTTRRGSRIPFPVPLHLLLLRPSLMLIFGGAMAWVGSRYLREFH